MRTLGTLWVVLLTACGSVAGDVDASLDSDLLPSIDASAPDATSPRCDPTRPFGAPQPVAALNSTAEDVTAWLTDDELTVMFASTLPGGAGGYDIYFATRATSDGTFGAPQLLNGANTAQSDLRPMMTADGLRLFAEHWNGSDYDVNVATRASTTVSFGASSPDPGLNAASQTDDAETILPDGSQIYFRSNRTGEMHLYTATWDGTAWSTPAQPTGTNLDSAQGEDYPFIAPDNLTLYITSARAGGIGGNDIWRAHRDSVVAGFGAPVLVAELATVDNELMGWASADDCVIYFTRNVSNSATGQDLYAAQRGL